MTGTTDKARFDAKGQAIVIDTMAIDDSTVLNEARHWTTGRRGHVPDELIGVCNADVTTFVREAIALGSRVLASTAQTAETQLLETMVKGVGEQTAQAAKQAAELTERAAKDASSAVTRVATDAKKAITEAEATNRKEITAAVGQATKTLVSETQRLFGGEHPELLERLRPLLNSFAKTLEAQVSSGTTELLAKAAKQFDPSDPSSPMAKHTAALTVSQKEFTERIEKNHHALAGKVDELTTALKVQQATTTLAKVTPIKGGSFEGQVHVLMNGIAAGLGGEYQDTTNKVGQLPRCKKGDGVLDVNEQDARVVVEVTDSRRMAWNEYFDEAERNRGAVASLGIVRTIAQNAGQSIRVLGSRRVVIAFNPDTDDPELLRTVVMLLRTVAIAASVRTGSEEVQTAEEKITEALAQLAKIDAMKKLAGAIQTNAAKIDSGCTAISTSIHRLLDEALTALAGAHRAAVEREITPGEATGAA
ncbi:MAG: Fis family transcriptional regulator [Micropruina sp.]